MMLGILIYTYSKGMRSSRKAYKEEVQFRFISGYVAPDHRAICQFRTHHEKQFKKNFNEFLYSCHKSYLLNLKNIFLDETKIKENSTSSSNYALDYINKILEEAKTVDKTKYEKFRKSENKDRLPKELMNHKERIKCIKAAKERLDRGLKQKQNEQAKRLGNIKRRILKDCAKPKITNEAKNEKKANITDTESRIMKNRSGFLQAYNCQAACTEDQIII